MIFIDRQWKKAMCGERFKNEFFKKKKDLKMKKQKTNK